MQRPENTIFGLNLSSFDLSFKFFSDIDAIVDPLAIFNLKDRAIALFKNR